MEVFVSDAAASGGEQQQEDRHIIAVFEDPALHDGGGHLMAVFDGSGGSIAATHACLRLSRYFLEISQLQEKRVVVALSAAIVRLGEALRDYSDGTTVSAAFISRQHRWAYVATLGDSPVIIHDRDEKLWVSPTHDIRINDREREAVCQRGARYSYGELRNEADALFTPTLSRSLGHKSFPFLSFTPEVHAVPLGEKSFVIVGTGGLALSGHMTTPARVQHVADIVAQGGDARALVQDALERKASQRNITAIVWQQREL